MASLIGYPSASSVHAQTKLPAPKPFDAIKIQDEG
jgi:hypothetical protein